MDNPKLINTYNIRVRARRYFKGISYEAKFQISLLSPELCLKNSGNHITTSLNDR